MEFLFNPVTRDEACCVYDKSKTAQFKGDWRGASVR